MASDRCVYFLDSYADRQHNALIRKRDARRKLLNTIEQINHECVHPLNPNYAQPGWTADMLFAWASMNGLLSEGDQRIRFGY